MVGASMFGNRPAPARKADPLPTDVIRLVIAAREAWQEHGSSGDDLDKALEAFAGRVPYEDEPWSPAVEQAARAIARRNYPGASASDIDEMWDSFAPDAEAALSAAAAGEPLASCASVLVRRLRHEVTMGSGIVTPLRLEASDAIETLTSENRVLTEALGYQRAAIRHMNADRKQALAALAKCYQFIERIANSPRQFSKRLPWVTSVTIEHGCPAEAAAFLAQQAPK